MRREANMLPGKLLLRHQEVQSSWLSRYSLIPVSFICCGLVVLMNLVSCFLLWWHPLLKDMANYDS